MLDRPALSQSYFVGGARIQRFHESYIILCVYLDLSDRSKM